MAVFLSDTEPQREARDASAWRSDEPRHVPEAWLTCKRTMDVAISAGVLAVTGPIVVASMIGIVVSSPGSPIFLQERVGQYGKRFSIIKLRTMRKNAHAELEALRGTNEVTGPVFKMKDDPRVFPFGRLLRKLSIDELPNLVNVLLGQMSIVGPRPPLPTEVEGYGEFALRRLRAKPGITCLWQMSGRSGIDFDEWMKLDHAYLDNWSPLYDLKIILATIPAVLFGRGAY